MNELLLLRPAPCYCAVRATAQYHKWWNMVEFLLGEWYESTPFYREYTPLGRRAPLWRLYYELERDYLLREETDDEQLTLRLNELTLQ